MNKGKNQFAITKKKEEGRCCLFIVITGHRLCSTRGRSHWSSHTLAGGRCNGGHHALGRSPPCRLRPALASVVEDRERARGEREREETTSGEKENRESGKSGRGHSEIEGEVGGLGEGEREGKRGRERERKKRR
jgi:hypothetical protein